MTVTCASVPQRIGWLATEALRAEAALSPKPGLVTPTSSGAHQDMDFRLLTASAAALQPCFLACAQAGAVAWQAGSSAADLFGALRRIGHDGEAAMWQATGGVNAHKGAIFCLGLLSAGLGSWSGSWPTGASRTSSPPASASTPNWG
jgi:triphosphoribosyl-dephospho-CoA synthetase